MNTQIRRKPLDFWGDKYEYPDKRQNIRLLRGQVCVHRYGQNIRLLAVMGVDTQIRADHQTSRGIGVDTQIQADHQTSRGIGVDTQIRADYQTSRGIGVDTQIWADHQTSRGIGVDTQIRADHQTSRGWVWIHRYGQTIRLLGDGCGYTDTGRPLDFQGMGVDKQFFCQAQSTLPCIASYMVSCILCSCVTTPFWDFPHVRFLTWYVLFDQSVNCL